MQLKRLAIVRRATATFFARLLCFFSSYALKFCINKYVYFAWFVWLYLLFFEFSRVPSINGVTCFGFCVETSGHAIYGRPARDETFCSKYQIAQFIRWCFTYLTVSITKYPRSRNVYSPKSFPFLHLVA